MGKSLAQRYKVNGMKTQLQKKDSKKWKSNSLNFCIIYIILDIISTGY